MVKLKKVFGLLLFLLFVLLLLGTGFLIGKKFKLGDRLLEKVVEQRIVKEESVVVEIAEKASPSVVTVSIDVPERQVLEFSPFSGFRRRTEGGRLEDIGSGFIVSEDGLVITNKHVVSDSNAKYKVITADDKEYEVKKIVKDPNNDLAIVKIEASNLKPLPLGSSNNLKVGQFVVAIGTALGEFRHTVTTGVVSGLGRGITAGSAFEGYIERLDNVIQTDAAINPGNSGGPLLNSLGEVIGINVAVAQGAENIGFAIPIDVVKKSLDEFNSSGKFVGKAYLGIRYEMISLSAAILNNVPRGAFVVEVVSGSPAEKAGIQNEDIITKIDGDEIKTGEDVGKIISKKKPGDSVSVEIYRNGETKTLNATLSEFSE